MNLSSGFIVVWLILVFGVSSGCVVIREPVNIVRKNQKQEFRSETQRLLRALFTENKEEYKQVLLELSWIGRKAARDFPNLYTVSSLDELGYLEVISSKGYVALGKGNVLVINELLLQHRKRKKDGLPHWLLFEIVKRMGTKAKAAAPGIAAYLGNIYLRKKAARILGVLQDQRTLPALARSLRSKNYMSHSCVGEDSRVYSLQAIARFGTDAKPILPTLRKLLVQDRLCKEVGKTLKSVFPTQWADIILTSQANFICVELAFGNDSSRLGVFQGKKHRR